MRVTSILEYLQLYTLQDTLAYINSEYVFIYLRALETKLNILATFSARLFHDNCRTHN